MQTVILRFGEIGTKGKNRSEIQSLLVRNIQKVFERNTGKKVEVINTRPRLYLNTDLCKEIIEENLKKCFGLVTYSFAHIVELDVEKIKQKIVELLKDCDKKKKIHVLVNRIEKNLYETPKLQLDLGLYVCETLGLEADYKNPDIEINVEIIDKAYVYLDKIKSAGGLPVGCSGSVLGLINSNECLESCLLAMKRGANVFPVFIEDGKKTKFTYDDAVKVCSQIQKHSPNNLHLKSLSEKELVVFAVERECTALVVADTLQSLHKYTMIAYRPRLML